MIGALRRRQRNVKPAEPERTWNVEFSKGTLNSRGSVSISRRASPYRFDQISTHSYEELVELIHELEQVATAWRIIEQEKQGLCEYAREKGWSLGEGC